MTINKSILWILVLNFTIIFTCHRNNLYNNVTYSQKYFKKISFRFLFWGLRILTLLSATTNMIAKSISEKILFVGPPYENPKGGIAYVIYAYSKLFEPFHFIKTTNLGHSVNNIICLIKALFIFLYKICNPNVQIIHIQGASKNSFWRAAIFICIAKLFHKKTIYHIHGGGFKSFSLQHKKAISYVFSKCDGIVALSMNWKRFFEHEFNLDNVKIIPNIIETPQENHTNRNETVIQFLFLGKICNEKGIFELVEVIDENNNSLIGKMKLIIGGNGETNRLERIIKDKKLDEIIQFVGWVNGEKKIEALNKSHVYILPSHIEVLPISILEAMSYHLPIISTRVGAIPDIVINNKNGFLVNPRDKDALKNAISEMISFTPEKREKMGQQSFNLVQPYLSFHVEKILEDLYLSLLKKTIINNIYHQKTSKISL